MPNGIKYSASNQTLALKKGNFWIGTGDVAKGPTVTTDYWNGLTPPTGGYTIYLNKVSGGPSVYVAANDSELISLSNGIAGQTFATAAAALNWFATQTDKMVVNMEYESILTDGLILNLDAGFVPSYPTTGTTWYDISSGGYGGTLTNGPTFNTGEFGGSIVFDGTDDYVITSNTNYDFSTNANFTYCAWIYPGFSSTSDTGRAVIDFTGAGPGFLRSYLRWEGFSSNLGFYFDIASGGGSAWNTDEIPTFSENIWHHLCFVHNSSNVGTFYFDGVEVPTVNSVADPATVTNNKITIGYGAVNSYYWLGRISSVQIYNRALTASEILQNYNAQKGRYDFDPDAQTFITNADITSSTEQNAINKLVVDLKAYNLWTKMLAIYPFVGSAATNHKYNLKDPQDTDAAYRLVFYGGWTHTSTGADPNGINAYADTFIVPNSVLTSTTDYESWSYYSRQNTTNTGEYVMGAGGSAMGNSCSLIIRRSNSISHSYSDYGNTPTYRAAQTTTSDGRGLFSGSQNGTSIKHYKNGTMLVQNTQTSSGLTRPTNKIMLGAISQGAGTPIDSWSTKECAFAHIGYKLDDTETANLYTAVQAFQTALGRQV